MGTEQCSGDRSTAGKTDAMHNEIIRRGHRGDRDNRTERDNRRGGVIRSERERESRRERVNRRGKWICMYERHRI